MIGPQFIPSYPHVYDIKNYNMQYDPLKILKSPFYKLKKKLNINLKYIG